MKTYSAKPIDVTRTWYLLDAAETPLGRLATVTATLLLGKGKPMFTKHIDCGDYVIIINADQLVITGNKSEAKNYYRHSGYPSGLTTTKLKDQVARDSTQAVIHAIRGMLPVNKLRADRLQRLKVYKGADHNHAAQKPTPISVKGSSQ